MSDREPAPPGDADEQRIRARAHLLPEEVTAGSVPRDEEAAAAILAESDIRTADPESSPDSFLERRTSAEATDPVT